jgi:hypothetical protein
MEDKDKYFKYFIIIAAILVAVSVLFPFAVNHYFDDWAKSGTFGDTFGALNAVFSGIAIAGLIVTILLQRKELAHQRVELALQRTEMQETRKEFLINRTTSVVYNQLERYERAVEQFNISHNGEKYIGHEAIFFLDISKKITYQPIDDDRSADEILRERKKNNCFSMKIYSSNDKSIAQFALSAYNSVMVIKEVLFGSDLTPDEVNDLKNLFFRNIGFIHLGVLEDIYDKYKEYLDLVTDDNDNYDQECDIDFGKLSKAHIFLKSLIKFRKEIITSDSVKSVKENWSREFGAYA